MNINLHIERLVLEGVDVPRHEHPRLQAAVAAELTRLLATSDIGLESMQRSAVSSVQGGSIEATHDDPAELGGQIARAIMHAVYGS
jgi:hypothetical protein